MRGQAGTGATDGTSAASAGLSSGQAELVSYNVVYRARVCVLGCSYRVELVRRAKSRSSNTAKKQGGLFFAFLSFFLHSPIITRPRESNLVHRGPGLHKARSIRSVQSAFTLLRVQHLLQTHG